ncbi:cytochrome P450 [Amycolatopsis magusensis]|uniref:cytochrome P450 n=1 Tax=Amycolatopsis magusensis TaxID=882444 RepID=UPI0024A8D7DA|nr:cytochrome P450 [Amycolatopsis magusensis]MDI5981498.1 cytochrome P450 [Amycolatopsis magusensis]
MTREGTRPPMAPGGCPVVGHALRLFRRPLEFVDQQRACGEVVSFRLGREPAFLVNSPATVRELLVEHNQVTKNGVLFEKLKVLGGDGIGSSWGEPHRQRRRMIAPLFTPQRVTEYAGTMRAAAEEQTSNWVDGAPLELGQELNEIAAAILVRCMFASDAGSEAAREAARWLPIVFRGVGKRAYAPTGLLYALPTRSNRLYTEAGKRVHALIDEVIAVYRAEGTVGRDMLSALLKARDPETGEMLTVQQVHDEVMTMFFVGTEVSSAALGWLFFQLDRHPEIADRVCGEIDDVLGDRPVEFDDLPKLEYVARVVHETLRLYPPGWLFPRIPTVDIEVGGYPIPAGANVFYSPYVLHRDPRLFPEPARFDPDRWLPERAGQVPRGAFIPYGEGVRVCMGGSFAAAEMLIVLTVILRRWRLPLQAGARVRPVASTTLHPDRLPVVARRR